jgi:flagellar biosynthesis protein FlhF
MKVKNYRAASLTEALDMVKRDLGSEAVILRTRRLNQTGLDAYNADKKYEVSAGLEPPRAEFSDDGGRRSPTLRMELSELKRTLDSFVREYRVNGISGSVRGLGGLVRHFQDRGVDGSILSELIGEVSGKVEDNKVPAAKQLRRDVLSGLLERISVAGPIRLKSKGAKVVALVGPTGTGKTTTIAKLASRFKIVEGKRVALISCDTFRIGAVEQLKTFAEIASMPLAVVFSPREMSAALKRFASYDLILIDTPGRSPYDTLHLKELKGLMAAAGPDEIHLTVPASGRYQDLVEVLRRFSAVAVSHLLFTKLDETSRYGDIVSLAIKSRKAVSYVTVGQNVPDDISLFRKRMAARMLLHGTYDA